MTYEVAIFLSMFAGALAIYFQQEGWPRINKWGPDIWIGILLCSPIFYFLVMLLRILIIAPMLAIGWSWFLKNGERVGWRKVPVKRIYFFQYSAVAACLLGSLAFAAYAFSTQYNACQMVRSYIDSSPSVHAEHGPGVTFKNMSEPIIGTSPCAVLFSPQVLFGVLGSALIIALIQMCFVQSRFFPEVTRWSAAWLIAILTALILDTYLCWQHECSI